MVVQEADVDDRVSIASLIAMLEQEPFLMSDAHERELIVSWV